MPRLSACLITRDEAKMLPDCLASLRGVVDEIIVVDTGSSDGTVRIAKKHGARVFHQPWKDDFSAPRNEALRHAKGDWILIIDADERVAPGAGPALRAAIENATWDCGMVRFHDASRPDATLNDVLTGRARQGDARHLPRLVRNTDGLAFTGIVHESFLPWLERRGMKLAFCPVDLIHYGGTREIRTERAKAARNIKLLEKHVAEQPDDIAAYGYLAHDYYATNDRDASWGAVERGWSRVSLGCTSVLRLATARIRLQLESGDLAGAIASTERAEAMETPHPDLDFLRGTAREMLALRTHGAAAQRALLESALKDYRAAQAKKETLYAQAFVNGAATWGGVTREATILMLLGKIAEARATFERALTIPGCDPREARLGLVECHLREDGPDAALMSVERWLDDRPDGWVLAAAAAEALGRFEDLALLLRKARATAANGFIAPHRRERHASLHVLLAAYLGTPTAGPYSTGALGALLAREPLPDPDAAPFEIDQGVLTRLFQNLLALDRAPLLEPLFEPRAEALLPGLGAALRKAASSLGLTVEDDGLPSPIFVGAFGAKELALAVDVLGAHAHLAVRPLAHDGELAAAIASNDDARLREIVLRSAGDKRPVFALPDAPLHAQRLYQAFPRARFLHVIRDARALAQPANDDGGDLLGDGSPEDRATRWAELTRAAREAIATTPTIELRYEDLLADPKAAIANLLAFLGEPDDEALQKKLAASYPGRADRWRKELAPAVVEAMTRRARAELAMHGYEAPLTPSKAPPKNEAAKEVSP